MVQPLHRNLAPPASVSPKQSGDTATIDYKKVWDGFCKSILEKTGGLVLVDEKQQRDYKQLVEEKQAEPRFYKGTFRFLDFKEKRPDVPFIMTEQQIPIGSIIHQISQYINVAPENIEITFKGKRLLDMDDNLLLACSFNGLGGEFFDVVVNRPKESYPPNFKQMLQK